MGNLPWRIKSEVEMFTKLSTRATYIETENYVFTFLIFMRLCDHIYFKTSVISTTMNKQHSYKHFEYSGTKIYKIQFYQGVAIHGAKIVFGPIDIEGWSYEWPLPVLSAFFLSVWCFLHFLTNGSNDLLDFL